MPNIGKNAAVNTYRGASGEGEQTEETEEVVILGAGFSRALSEAMARRSVKMPLGDELGNEVITKLAPETRRALGVGRFGAYRPFEGWLSLLAEGVPYLGETGNLELRAHFSRLQDAIGQLLVERERELATKAWPEWLPGLLAVWAKRSTTVITFNYDTLIERALDAGLVPTALASDHGSQTDGQAELVVVPAARFTSATLNASAVLANQPPLAPDPPPLQVAGFRLLKLHGSLDWWHVPGDPSDMTLQRAGTGCGPADAGGGDGEVDRALPGRERFLVPPLVGKSRWFSSPLLRHLWQQAFRALSRAKRIAVVGYSLPVADLVTAGMLEASLRGRADQVEMSVVNLCPEAVAQRLIALGADQARLCCVKQVADYARKCIDDEAARAVEGLRQILQPIAGQVDNEIVWLVVGSQEMQADRAECDGEALVVHPRPPDAVVGPGGAPLLRPPHGRPPGAVVGPVTVRAADLLGQLEHCRQVVIESPAGRSVVTDYRLPSADPTRRWTVSLLAPGVVRPPG